MLQEESEPLIQYTSEGRPITKLPWSTLDWILTITSMALSAILIIWFFIDFDSMPSRVPLHWGINGEVDMYGSKYFLLLYPFLAVLSTVGFNLLARIPETYKYKNVKVTIANCQEVYAIGRATMLYVCCVVNALMIIIFYITIVATMTGVTDFILLIGTVVGFIALVLIGVWVQECKLDKFREEVHQ